MILAQTCQTKRGGRRRNISSQGRSGAQSKNSSPQSLVALCLSIRCLGDPPLPGRSVRTIDEKLVKRKSTKIEEGAEVVVTEGQHNDLKGTVLKVGSRPGV